MCSGPAEIVPVGVGSDCLNYLCPVGLCFLIITWLLVCLQCGRPRFNPWVGKISWRRKWQPTPVFLPGKIPWTEEPGRVQSTGLQKSWTRYTTEEQLSKNLACPAIRDVGNKPQECQQHRDCHQQKSPVFSFSRYTCCRDQELPFVVMATSKSTLLLHFVR